MTIRRRISEIGMLGYMCAVGILVFYGYLNYLIPLYHVVCAYSFYGNAEKWLSEDAVGIDELMLGVVWSWCIECGGLVARAVTDNNEWYILVSAEVHGMAHVCLSIFFLYDGLVADFFVALAGYSGMWIGGSLLGIVDENKPQSAGLYTGSSFSWYLGYISRSKEAAETNYVYRELTAYGDEIESDVPVYTVYMCTRSAAAVLLEFYALQERMFIVEAETSLVLYRMYNPTLFDTVSIVVYCIVPEEYTMNVRKLQCFCFDILYVQPLESIELPVLFYIEALENMRKAVKNIMFYYYLLAV